MISGSREQAKGPKPDDDDDDDDVVKSKYKLFGK